MSRFLIIPDINDLESSVSIAREYGFGFEFNDFFHPSVLDDENRLSEIIGKYSSAELPELRTSHGDFFDVIVFSEDKLIRDISEKRIRQSIAAAERIGASGVVFHTNHCPQLKLPSYLKRWEDLNYDFWSRILSENRGMNIYIENMFDDDPDVLAGLAERLCDNPNFGVCLDYAHACVFGGSPERWVETLHPYVKHIHINDNDMVADLHLAVGDGLIDWELFGDYNSRLFSSCTVLIEVNGAMKQRKSAEFLRKLNIL